MTATTTARKSIFAHLRDALTGAEADYTQGSLRKAIFLLAIPMIAEMIMESVFALVDLYFVGHLPNPSTAIQTVGLTESVVTIVYSLSIGISMAATAVVARRIGEKDPEAAAQAGGQAILLASLLIIALSIPAAIWAPDILRFMGASESTVVRGTPYTRLMMGSSIVIMLLFLINGIFRGAGDASMAMRSLWIANIANIILCPIFIRGLGPIPAFGLTGAAIATTLGRGIGVAYQLYHLFRGGRIRLRLPHLHWKGADIWALVKIAAPGTFQFIIASCSWIFLARWVAETGGDTASAGYQVAIRIVIFFILPAWGLSNAAATLVGQNLGAGQPQRAEDSVLKTAKYNAIFMGTVMVLLMVAAPWIVSRFTSDAAVSAYAVKAVRIVCSGYIFYAIGMVMANAFNGAGDTWTPTFINLAGFWAFQLPLAYFLSHNAGWGPTGVFTAIPVAETCIAVAAFVLFRRGKWKAKKV